VLTCDSENRGGRYHLLVRNGCIAEISNDLQSLVRGHPSADIIDATGKLVIPGFVNSHFHGESYLLREVTAGRHFACWPSLRDYTSLRAALLDPAHLDVLGIVYKTAYCAHLKSGTTTVGEFPPPSDGRGLQVILEAIRSTGVSSVVVLQTWDQIEEVRTMSKNRPMFMISLGKEEDFTVYSFESACRTARELKAPLVAHAAEKRSDAETVRGSFHKDVVCLLRDYGALREETLLVHLNHASARDLAAVEEAGGTIVVCARSALEKQTGYPSLRHMDGKRMQLCVGTDWGNTDVLADLQFLRQLPLYFRGMPAFSPLELLRMGTIQGAKALGCSADRGSIEPGKRADLVMYFLDDLRVRSLGAAPGAAELADLFMTSLSSRDVADVMIAGKVLLAHGFLSMAAEQDLLREFRDMRQRLMVQPVPGRPESESRRERGGAVRQASIPLEIADMPADAEEGGFESGLPPPPEEAASPVPPVAANDMSRKMEERPVVKPELPKDIRRVFGEEDDL